MAGSKDAGVFFVTEFGIWSSVFPMATFAATLAIGYPVALDASAEDLDTRGLTSMTMYSCVFGCRANCTLQPPSTLRARIIFNDASLSIWLSSSLKVSAGATTMLSPVCMPMGSMFSMEQMVMQLFAESRMTSYSISY